MHGQGRIFFHVWILGSFFVFSPFGRFFGGFLGCFVCGFLCFGGFFGGTAFFGGGATGAAGQHRYSHTKGHQKSQPFSLFHLQSSPFIRDFSSKSLFSSAVDHANGFCQRKLQKPSVLQYCRLYLQTKLRG